MSELGVTASAPPDGLQVTGVTVRFGGLTALNDVSLNVPPRSVVGVIGPNGSGKTTLFNVVCGFVRPDGGTLHWRGRRLARARPHQLAHLGIARTLQGLGLFAGLTVRENVLVGAERHARAGFVSALLALPRSDHDEAVLRERSDAVLAELGIAEVADRRPGELPYGVQKRVVLARALVADPSLVMLDEPASGLSATEMDELAGVIRRLRDERGTSVLLVEHHMELVLGVCDAVTVLDFGRVIASGTPEQIRADEAVTAAYLGVDDAVG